MYYIVLHRDVSYAMGLYVLFLFDNNRHYILFAPIGILLANCLAKFMDHPFTPSWSTDVAWSPLAEPAREKQNITRIRYAERFNVYGPLRTVKNITFTTKTCTFVYFKCCSRSYSFWAILIAGMWMRKSFLWRTTAARMIVTLCLRWPRTR